MEAAEGNLLTSDLRITCAPDTGTPVLPTGDVATPAMSRRRSRAHLALQAVVVQATTQTTKRCRAGCGAAVSEVACRSEPTLARPPEHEQPLAGTKEPREKRVPLGSVGWASRDPLVQLIV